MKTTLTAIALAALATTAYAAATIAETAESLCMPAALAQVLS
jgi:hypothetical protein